MLSPRVVAHSFVWWCAFFGMFFASSCLCNPHREWEAEGKKIRYFDSVHTK